VVSHNYNHQDYSPCYLSRNWLELTSKCSPSYPIDAFQITLTQNACYNLSTNTTKYQKDSYFIELILLQEEACFPFSLSYYMTKRLQQRKRKGLQERDSYLKREIQEKGMLPFRTNATYFWSIHPIIIVNFSLVNGFSRGVNLTIHSKANLTFNLQTLNVHQIRIEAIKTQNNERKKIASMQSKKR